MSLITMQRQFYDFIGGIYTALYHDPTFIGMTTASDETEDRPSNNNPTVYRGRPVRMCYYFKTLRTRELSREILDGGKALYAWVADHYEIAV